MTESRFEDICACIFFLFCVLILAGGILWLLSIAAYVHFLTAALGLVLLVALILPIAGIYNVIKG